MDPNLDIKITRDNSSRSDSRTHCVDRLEELCSSCREKSQRHTVLSRIAHKNHVYISIPSLIVAAVTTSVAYVPVGRDVRTRGDDWTPIFIAVIATVNAILVGIVNFFKWDKISNDHATAAKNYALLSNEIKDYLIKMPHESEVWFNDIQSFTKRHEEILLNSPLHY